MNTKVGLKIVDLTKDEKFINKQKKLEGKPEFILEGLLLRINERIAEELQKKDLNYSEFAKLLGVSQPYISKLMNGKPNLTIKSLSEIASVLGLKFTDDIFIENKIEDMFQQSYFKISLTDGSENDSQYNQFAFTDDLFVENKKEDMFQRRNFKILPGRGSENDQQYNQSLG